MCNALLRFRERMQAHIGDPAADYILMALACGVAVAWCWLLGTAVHLV
jgi:hypothetical protein